MKMKYSWILAFGFLVVLQVACQSKSTTTGPTNTGGGSGGTTITVNVTSNTSLNPSTGYIYTASGATNAAGGLLSLTAHVGNTLIIIPNAGIGHPLYFDAGSTSCISNGTSSSPLTYTFSATGTYYFHCGNHGVGCSNGITSCGSTNCSGMAGMITVN